MRNLIKLKTNLKQLHPNLKQRIPNIVFTWFNFQFICFTMVFSLIKLHLKWCRNQIRTPSCSCRRDASKYMHVDIKKLMSNLNSSQGHVRSRGNPDRPCCMSLNASRQEKLIGTKPLLALCSIKGYRQKKNVFDLMWPRMTRRRGHGVKPMYGSLRVAWHVTILKYSVWLTFSR